MKGIEKIRMMLALMLVSMKRRLPETRRLSSGITTLTLAGIVLLVAAGSVSAAPCPAPGNTVITSSCELDQNWNVPAGQAGYIIGADGVTIDGMGLYKITGSVTKANCEWASETSPCTKSGIYNTGYDNVVIKNMEIESFCTGIALAGSGGNKVRNITVDNCKIHDNGFNTTSGGSGMTTQGIHACHINGTADVPALTIVNNEIYNTEGTGSGCGDGGNGIFVYSGGGQPAHEYCNISYNDLHHNAKSGFWTKMMLSRCSITHNHAWENGGGAGVMGDDVHGGIILRCMLSNENLIAYNNASNNGRGGNYGYGIYVGGSNNTIFNNTVNDNTKSGIYMGRSDGSDWNNVSCNYACGNAECDIGTCGGTGPAPDGCCGNYGDCNTYGICCNCDGCNDITRCHYCPGTGINLKTTATDGTWVTQTQTYTVHYTVESTGWNTSYATHAGIWIDGELVDVQYVPPLGPNAAAGREYIGTSGPHPVNTSVAVNGATYIDTIRVCADIYDEETREEKETDNCYRDSEEDYVNFGGPDLRISHAPGRDYYFEWIDTSWKTFNIIFNVTNIGDNVTEHDCWVNFTEIHCDWGCCVDPDCADGCVDPVCIPAGFDVGESVMHTVGPFVMEGAQDWIQIWVNFNNTTPVNNWDKANRDRGRFTSEYGGSYPCWDATGDITECGDADCSGGVTNTDARDAFDRTYLCGYAADADCSGGVTNIDARDIFNRDLNCCKGCEL
jgi:parallel beta-helix repeat protein